jgi:hypothetical protein
MIALATNSPASASVKKDICDDWKESGARLSRTSAMAVALTAVRRHEDHGGQRDRQDRQDPRGRQGQDGGGQQGRQDRRDPQDLLGRQGQDGGGQRDRQGQRGRPGQRGQQGRGGGLQVQRQQHQLLHCQMSCLSRPLSDLTSSAFQVPVRLLSCFGHHPRSEWTCSPTRLDISLACVPSGRTKV